MFAEEVARSGLDEKTFTGGNEHLRGILQKGHTDRLPGPCGRRKEKEKEGDQYRMHYLRLNSQKISERMILMRMLVAIGK